MLLYVRTCTVHDVSEVRGAGRWSSGVSPAAHMGRLDIGMYRGFIPQANAYNPVRWIGKHGKS